MGGDMEGDGGRSGDEMDLLTSGDPTRSSDLCMARKEKVRARSE